MKMQLFLIILFIYSLNFSEGAWCENLTTTQNLSAKIETIEDWHNNPHTAYNELIKEVQQSPHETIRAQLNHIINKNEMPKILLSNLSHFIDQFKLKLTKSIDRNILLLAAGRNGVGKSYVTKKYFMPLFSKSEINYLPLDWFIYSQNLPEEIKNPLDSRELSPNKLHHNPDHVRKTLLSIKNNEETVIPLYQNSLRNRIYLPSSLKNKIEEQNATLNYQIDDQYQYELVDVTTLTRDIEKAIKNKYGFSDFKIKKFSSETKLMMDINTFEIVQLIPPQKNKIFIVDSIFAIGNKDNISLFNLIFFIWRPESEIIHSLVASHRNKERSIDLTEDQFIKKITNYYFNPLKNRDHQLTYQAVVNADIFVVNNIEDGTINRSSFIFRSSA